MLVDRTDRLERLRRTYSNYSNKSKGPYRRLLVTGHGLKMLEKLKSLNPNVAFEDIMTHALSCALDFMPEVPEGDRDDSTRRRAEDIMAMYDHTIQSWCNYRGFTTQGFLHRCCQIDKQFNMFQCGKSDIPKQKDTKGTSLKAHKFDQAFEEDFGLVLMRIAGNEVITYD